MHREEDLKGFDKEQWKGSVCKACLYGRVGLAYWKEPRLCQEVNRRAKVE